MQNLLNSLVTHIVSAALWTRVSKFPKTVDPELPDAECLIPDLSLVLL